MGGERDFIVGVDLGATKILAAAWRLREGAARPKALAEAKIKTPRTGEPAALVAALAEAVRAVIAEAVGASGSPSSTAGSPVGRAASLGIAVPGPLDRERGIVRYTPNLGLEDYPLAAALEKELGLPVRLENDVQAGVYGELKAGALRGKRHAIGVFVGTGIGGGLVIDGELYRGSTGSAGEVGHMILLEGGALCGCGNYGCLEALASRTALAKDALALAASGKSPAMLAAAGTDLKRYRSSAFEEALEAKDEAIGRAVDRAAFWLGVGLANLVNLLNPEAIVLGGGVVARFGKRYREGAEASMRDRLMPGLADTVEILLSELGDLAVPAGAALMAAAETSGSAAGSGASAAAGEAAERGEEAATGGDAGLADKARNGGRKKR